MDTQKEMKIGKVIWVMGSIVLSIAVFIVVRKEQDKLTDILIKTLGEKNKSY